MNKVCFPINSTAFLIKIVHLVEYISLVSSITAPMPAIGTMNLFINNMTTLTSVFTEPPFVSHGKLFN